MSKLADQIVTHLRVGRAGDRTEVRLGLRLGKEDVEVRLRQTGDKLVAQVVGSRVDGERLAEGIRGLLSERGVEAEVEVSDR